MSLKDELLKWQDAVDAFEQQNYSKSINTFIEITDVGAKVYFNMGMIYSILDRQEDAVISFTNATYQDQYMAVAFFQKSVSQWIVRDYWGAIDSLTAAKTNMRDNQHVDYRQLGLNYILYSFEIMLNRAFCYFAVGELNSAIADLNAAQREISLPDHKDPRYTPNLVQQAYMRSPQIFNDDYPLFTVPEQMLFKPPQLKIKNVGKVDYMGKSQVIASVDNQDNFVGFVGPKVRQALVDSVNEMSISSKPSTTSSRPRSAETTLAPRRANPSVYGGRGQPRSPEMDQATMMNRKPGRIDTSPGVLQPQFDGLRTAGPSMGRVNNPPLSGFPSENQREYMPVQKSTSNRSQNDYSSPRSAYPAGGNDYSPQSASPSNNFSPRSMYRQAGEDHSPRSAYPRNTLDPAAARLKVKCHLNNETRLIMLNLESASFDYLVRKICDKYQSLSPGSLKIKYKDEDGELMLMTDDEDLEMAMMQIGSDKKLEIFLA